MKNFRLRCANNARDKDQRIARKEKPNKERAFSENDKSKNR